MKRRVSWYSNPAMENLSSAAWNVLGNAQLKYLSYKGSRYPATPIKRKRYNFIFRLIIRGQIVRL